MEVAPLGYYAPRGDKVALQRALIELSALVGVFQKPKFFQYVPSLCVHGRYGISGCNRCLDACPAKAISSQGNNIEVDPYLCQGCSTCMLVCPSGAISPNLALQRSPLERMQALLESHPDRADCCLLLYDKSLNKTLNNAFGGKLPSAVISMELRELASAGIETWLAALALGVGSVVLLAGQNLGKRSLAELCQQLDHAWRILGSMGYDADRLRLIEGVDEHGLPTEILSIQAVDSPSKAMTFLALNTKRQIIEKALESLVSTAPNLQREVVLGRGAPLGSLEIERDSCTLCMGCVKVCPTTALRSEGDETQPQLGFVEGLCVQCGICSAACPEKAIRLMPRLTYDGELRSRVRVLNESPPFHCVSCGRPFTTKAIFDLMNERLKDNPLFQGDGLKKLQQCPDCRARDHIIEPLQLLAVKQKQKEEDNSAK
jgi:ferredoxin